MPGTRNKSFVGLTASADPSHVASPIQNSLHKLRSMSHEPKPISYHHRRVQSDRRGSTSSSDDTVIASQAPVVVPRKTGGASLATTVDPHCHDEAFLRKSLALLNTPLPDVPSPTALITLSDLPSPSSCFPARPFLPPPLPPRARPVNAMHSWMPTPEHSPPVAPTHRSQHKATPQCDRASGRHQRDHQTKNNSPEPEPLAQQSRRSSRRASNFLDSKIDDDEMPFVFRAPQSNFDPPSTASSETASSFMAPSQQLCATVQDQQLETNNDINAESPREPDQWVKQHSGLPFHSHTTQVIPPALNNILTQGNNWSTVELRVFEAHEACLQAQVALAKSKAALEAVMENFDRHRARKSGQETVTHPLNSPDRSSSLSSHQGTLIPGRETETPSSPPITQASLDVDASDSSTYFPDTPRDLYSDDFQRRSVDGCMSFMSFKLDGGSDHSGGEGDRSEDANEVPEPNSSSQEEPGAGTRFHGRDTAAGPDSSFVAVESSRFSSSSPTPLQSPMSSSADAPLRRSESTHLMYAMNNSHISEQSIRDDNRSLPTGQNQDALEGVLASHAQQTFPVTEQQNQAGLEDTVNSLYTVRQEDEHMLELAEEGQPYTSGGWQYDSPVEADEQSEYPALVSRSDSMTYEFYSSLSRDFLAYRSSKGYELAEEGEVISPEMIDSSSGDNVILGSSSQKLKLVEIVSPEPIKTPPPMRSGSSMLRNYSSLERISEEIERGNGGGSNRESMNRLSSQFFLGHSESEHSFGQRSSEVMNAEEQTKFNERMTPLEERDQEMTNGASSAGHPSKQELDPNQKAQHAESGPQEASEKRDVTDSVAVEPSKETTAAHDPDRASTQAVTLAPQTPDRNLSLDTRQRQALTEETPQSARTLSSLIGDHMEASQGGKSSTTSNEIHDASPLRPFSNWRVSASLKATGGVVKETIRRLETQNQLLQNTNQYDSDFSANDLVQSHWSSETSQFNTSNSSLGFQLRSDLDDKFGMRSNSLAPARGGDSSVSCNVSSSGIDAGTSVSRMNLSDSQSGIDADASQSCEDEDGPHSDLGLGVCDSAASLFGSQLQSTQSGHELGHDTTRHHRWPVVPDSAYDPLLSKSPITDIGVKEKLSKLYPITTNTSGPTQELVHESQSVSERLELSAQERRTYLDAGQTSLEGKKSRLPANPGALKGKLAKAFFDKSRRGKDAASIKTVDSPFGGSTDTVVPCIVDSANADLPCNSKSTSAVDKKVSLAVDVAQANAFRGRRSHIILSEPTPSPTKSSIDHSGWLSRRFTKAANGGARKATDHALPATVAVPELSGTRPGHVKLSHRLFDRNRNSTTRKGDSPPTTTDSDKSRSNLSEKLRPESLLRRASSHTRKTSWSSVKSSESISPGKSKQDKNIVKTNNTKVDKGKGRAVSPEKDGEDNQIHSKSTASDHRGVRSNTVDSPVLPSIKHMASTDFLIPPDHWPFDDDNAEKLVSPPEPPRPTLQRTLSTPSRTSSSQKRPRDDGSSRADLDLNLTEHRLDPSVLMSWNRSNSSEDIHGRAHRRSSVVSDDCDAAGFHTASAGTPVSRTSPTLSRDQLKSCEDLSSRPRQSSEPAPPTSVQPVMTPQEPLQLSTRSSLATITTLTPKASFSDMSLTSAPSYTDMKRQASSRQSEEKQDENMVREQARRNFQDWIEKQARTRRYWDKGGKGTL
ncbi:unnamed protein product [Sympodiomycopsis kandeliae]